MFQETNEYLRKPRYSEGPHATYFMLVAFAVEDMLKAYLVREKKVEFQSEITKTGSLPERLQTHDIAKLMTECGLPIAQFEQLAHRLSRAATWFGRYPVPQHFRKINLVRFSGGEEYSLVLAVFQDVEDLQLFIYYIRNNLSI